jgi:hypothetical protein
MGEIADMYRDMYYAGDWEDEEEEVSCKFCYEGHLYWEQVDGKWRLIDYKNKEHICRHIKARIKFLKGDI